MLRFSLLVFLALSTPSDACNFIECPGKLFGPFQPKDLLPGDFRKAADNIEDMLLKRLPESIAVAGQQALDSADNAIGGTAANLALAADKIVDVGGATLRFFGREIEAIPDILSNADQRFREGKVVDAFWHLGTEPLQESDDNAAKAFQESELLSSVAQGAASFYGGPTGAAAFAAWQAYHVTDGNLEMSLKAGVLAYAMASGYADTASMPTGTPGEVARKAATSGAMAGLSVAAAGGSTEESLEAFLRGGGGVIIQSGHAYVRETAANSIQISQIEADADLYCVTAFGGKCSDLIESYRESDRTLSEWKDLAAQPRIDVIFKDGNWLLTVLPNDVQSTLPGGIAPSVVTYIGPGSAYREKLLEIAALGGYQVGTSDPKQLVRSVRRPPRHSRPLTLDAHIAMIDAATDRNAKNAAKLAARRFIARDFEPVSLSYRYESEGHLSTDTYRFRSYDPVSNTLVLDYTTRDVHEIYTAPRVSNDWSARVTLDLTHAFRVDTDEMGFSVSCNGPGTDCVRYEALNGSCYGGFSSCAHAWHFSVFDLSNPQAAHRLRRFAQTIVYQIDGRPPR